MKNSNNASSIEQYGMYIGGDWVPASDGGEIKSSNPYKEELWATVPDATLEDVDKAVGAAEMHWNTVNGLQ